MKTGGFHLFEEIALMLNIMNAFLIFCLITCYITVEFATAESQNGVSIIQQMCHKMILIHDYSVLKEEVLQIYCFMSFSE